MGFLDGYNWVYSMHVFFVAPLLILCALAVIYKQSLKISDNLILMLMYTLLAMGIAVLGYHGNKLKNNY